MKWIGFVWNTALVGYFFSMGGWRSLFQCVRQDTRGECNRGPGGVMSAVEFFYHLY